MPSEPQLNHLLIIEDDRGRREFTLDASTYSIGRDAQCDVRLVSQFVSRRHATLHQMPGMQRAENLKLMRHTEEPEGAAKAGTFYYRIVDGDGRAKPSANGLLINGRKLQVHDLQNGDEIIFGPGVRAIYYLLKRDPVLTIPPDEFDITLISPNMIGEPEDEPKESAEARSPTTPPSLEDFDFSEDLFEDDLPEDDLPVTQPLNFPLSFSEDLPKTQPLNILDRLPTKGVPTDRLPADDLPTEGVPADDLPTTQPLNVSDDLPTDNPPKS